MLKVLTATTKGQSAAMYGYLKYRVLKKTIHVYLSAASPQIEVLQAVHNSGVISGTFMNNGAVRCGTTVCRPISGIYTKTNPNNGYVHVATIPVGASNITITELQNSQNYLGK
uniref:ADAMTS/ADAMTS-like Spacer 1 domain-containing protein n=1 Tax=Anopheles culicifacies TaxID=139723 RepID=A0A182LVC0_9DIPT